MSANSLRQAQEYFDNWIDRIAEDSSLEITDENGKILTFEPTVLAVEGVQHGQDDMGS